MARPVFANMKGDEKRFEIEQAARTLKEFARVKKDKKLLAAARKELQREIADSKKAMTI